MSDLEGGIRISHTDDGTRSRAAVFFRLILFIPHLIWLGIWTIGAVIVAPVHWVAALILGRPAGWAYAFYSAYVRYVLHVFAYWYLAAGRYPGFIGEPGYVVDAEFPPLEGQRRWTIALRFFIALPALILATALSGGVDGSYGNTGAQDSDAQAYWGSLGGLGTSIAVLAWFASLALARTPGGLRDAQVYCQGYAAQAFGYLLLLSDRYPTSDPRAIALDPMPPHPVRLRVDDDPARNRLTVAFRIILVIPYFLWSLIWGIAAFFAAIAGWFAALFSGRLPESLHRFLSAFVRYSTHVSAFFYILGGPFPGFVGRPGSYHVDLDIDDPELQHRAKTVFRIILAIPAWFVAGGFGTVALIAAVGTWFCVLFTGRIPEGLHGLLAWAVRYQGQSYSYALLLTDRYPYTGPDGRGREEPPPEAGPELWQFAPERP